MKETKSIRDKGAAGPVAGRGRIGYAAPAQFRSTGVSEELLPGSAQVQPFSAPVQKKDSGSVNGISFSENEAVKQLTDGAVDLHASGSKVETTSTSDSRLKDVGARSMAVGGNALIGDSRDRGHEIWHLAQQHQGMVQPTTTVNDQPVNDDPGLEKEADEMGAKIMQGKFNP